MMSLWQVDTHLQPQQCSLRALKMSQRTHEVTDPMMCFILQHFNTWKHIYTFPSRAFYKYCCLHPTTLPWVLPALCDVRRLLPREVRGDKCTQSSPGGIPPSSGAPLHFSREDVAHFQVKTRPERSITVWRASSLTADI